MWNPEVNMWNPLDWGQSSCLSDRGLKREVNDQPKSSQVHRKCNVGQRFVDFLVVSETRTAVYDGVFKQVPVGSRQIYKYRLSLNTSSQDPRNPLAHVEKLSCPLIWSVALCINPLVG